MKTFFYLLLTSFFLGCGSSNESDTNETTIAPPLFSGTLFEEQWSINHNSEFYAKNSIDENAHINVGSILNTYSGKGIKLAVIDDGFDVNHPEIKDKIIRTINVTTSEVNTDVSHTLAYDYHGTAVAGIIASSKDSVGVDGIAPDIELILIKMPEDLSDSIVVELFKQAVDAGAQVINCSWGTGDVSDVVKDYINSLDVTIVFASGNSNHDMGNDESAIKNVIAVGATDKNNLRASYSDYGKELDIVAPGGNALGITTIDPVGDFGISIDGFNRYDEYEGGLPVSFIGTSAAAPIVSAAIALALEVRPRLSNQEIKELLKYSTNTIGNNTPYIDDMVTSSSLTPTITGLYGAIQNSEIKVQLLSHENSTIFGPYSVDSIGNNEWSSSVTDVLSEGNYSVKVISSDESIIWATDMMFEVNSSKNSLVDKSKRKSDYYGYGKVNLRKFIDNVLSM